MAILGQRAMYIITKKKSKDGKESQIIENLVTNLVYLVHNATHNLDSVSLLFSVLLHEISVYLFINLFPSTLFIYLTIW